MTVYMLTFLNNLVNTYLFPYLVKVGKYLRKLKTPYILNEGSFKVARNPGFYLQETGTKRFKNLKRKIKTLLKGTDNKL